MPRRSFPADFVPRPAKDHFARLAERNRHVYGLKIRWLARRTDVFLISYPKAGRTWLRVMLGRALQRQLGIRGRNVLRLTAGKTAFPGLPRILATHDDSPQWKAPERIFADKRAYRGRRVVLLVRDPRDVVVSLYHHRTGWYRGTDQEYVGSIDDFVTERVGGFDSLLRFYEVWDANRAAPEAFLLVRYEDLRADPGGQLRRVLDFVGVGPVGDEVVDEAVRFAGFRNMRRLENRGALRSKALRVRDPDDPSARRVRRGRVGGYRDELSPAVAAELDRRLAESGGVFGYVP